MARLPGSGVVGLVSDATVHTLQAVLRLLKMPISGAKASLQQRILLARPKEVEAAFERILPPQSLLASRVGRTISQLHPLTLTMPHPGCEWLLEPTQLITVHNVVPPGPMWNMGATTLTQIEKNFIIPPVVCTLLAQPGFEMHISCIQLHDRCTHWPCHANLTLNNQHIPVPCRTKQMDGTPKANDLPGLFSSSPVLMNALREASNSGQGLGLRVCLAGYDTRAYAICAYVAKKLTIAEMRVMISPMPSLADAHQRAVAHALPPDEDDEVQMIGGLQVSLRCPLSLTRITTPVRCTACTGMAVFDLDSYLRMASASCRWKCPLCSTQECMPEKLVCDPYIANILATTGASVHTVEIMPGGAYK